MVISLRVSVPVLSKQITDAYPRVSTEPSFLTMAWCLAMPHTQGKGNLNHIRHGWVHEDEVIHSVLPPEPRPASGNMPSLIDCSCLESLANPVMPRSSQRFGGLLEEIRGGETKTLCGCLPSRNHNIYKHRRNHQGLHPHGNLPLHTA